MEDLVGLPLLPGYSFPDPTKTRFHIPQTLGYRNGYATPMTPRMATGCKLLHADKLPLEDLEDKVSLDPSLIYGRTEKAPVTRFVPAYCAFDKKVLRFDAYFKECVSESRAEYYRVRPVIIYYYLEDDTISVVEPVVDNSGLPQGKLIKRHRLPKNIQGDYWSWKDLNLQAEVAFYGRVFHIVNCDMWTREYLESEGIEVSSPVEMPTDPYIINRAKQHQVPKFTTPSDFDKRRQFVEMDRKVLRYYCVWDDRDSLFGELRPYIMHYYLVDDTVEMKEVYRSNDGRDPYPLLLKRQKLPKDPKNLPSSFPSCVIEMGKQEIQDWYGPQDLMIGQTIFVFGRRFLIYDIDEYTKNYYRQHFQISEFEKLEVTPDGKKIPPKLIPPYTGFGSLEDSLQSCLSLVPKPPKKDVIKMLENDNKVLRFEARMISVKPEDKNRRFIISYHLADDMITIYEPPVKNSGMRGGHFLRKTRISRPDSTTESPIFYSPVDFYIGAVIQAFCSRFLITGADEYVLKYTEKNSAKFPSQYTESLRSHFGQTAVSDSFNTEGPE